jgi:peptidoglycan/xylan/chitin deacetylase (PgdA/CDA1 family)
VIALRFDIDTYRGLAVQTPPLLDLLDEFSVPATFFCVMGREANLYEIVRLRLFAPSESKSRLNVEAKGGPMSILKAALRPRWVGARNHDLLREIVDRGHELQPHGWSHIRWQRSIDHVDPAEHIYLASQALEEAIGHPATGWAAPGRTTSGAALQAIDDAGLLYAGDLEGAGPFVPPGHHHVQLPLTRFETIAQMRQRGLSNSEIVDTYISDISDNPEYCCLYEHPDDLGPDERDILRAVLREIRDRGLECTTLEPIARSHLASIT